MSICLSLSPSLCLSSSVSFSLSPSLSIYLSLCLSPYLSLYFSLSLSLSLSLSIYIYIYIYIYKIYIYIYINLSFCFIYLSLSFSLLLYLPSPLSRSFDLPHHRGLASANEDQGTDSPGLLYLQARQWLASSIRDRHGQPQWPQGRVWYGSTWAAEACRFLLLRHLSWKHPSREASSVEPGLWSQLLQAWRSVARSDHWRWSMWSQLCGVSSSRRGRQ